MRRPGILAVTTASLLIVGVVFSAGDAVAQQKSLKEQLIGTWTLVSVHNVRSDGHFAFVNTRSDLPKFASNTRDQGTPEEYRAVVQGSLAYFGTYSISVADKVIIVQVEGSTFANLIGRADQKRIITSLTEDDLKFRNPATPSGATLEVAWKRAK